MFFPNIKRYRQESVILMANVTLTVTVGGITKKPGVVDDRIEIREFLDLTISIDHDVVDGAPKVRFVTISKASSKAVMA